MDTSLTVAGREFQQPQKDPAPSREDKERAMNLGTRASPPRRCARQLEPNGSASSSTGYRGAASPDGGDSCDISLRSSL